MLFRALLVEPGAQGNHWAKVAAAELGDCLGLPLADLVSLGPLHRNGQRVGPLEGYSSELIVQEAIDWLGKLAMSPDRGTRGAVARCLGRIFDPYSDPLTTVQEQQRQARKQDHRFH